MNIAIERNYDEGYATLSIDYGFLMTFKEKLGIVKEVTREIFGEVGEDMCEYLDDYELPSHEQLRNKRLLKALNKEDFNQLQKIFNCSKLKKVTTGPPSLVELVFTAFGFSDLLVLMDFIKEYNIELTITTGSDVTHILLDSTVSDITLGAD